MTVNIIQTTTTILDENRKVISVNTIETYVLYPAPGKALKNINNGKIYDHSINLGTKANAKDYIEIVL